MSDYQKINLVINNLDDGYSLAVYDFINDTAIIRDIEKDVLLACDIVFNRGRSFAINIVPKDSNILLANDIFLKFKE